MSKENIIYAINVRSYNRVVISHYLDLNSKLGDIAKQINP